MRTRTLAFTVALILAAAALQFGQTLPQDPNASRYLTPPRVIVDILDAPPTPGVIVSPDRHTIALLDRRSMPAIFELAQPIHRIAGARINPKTNGRQQRSGGIVAITLRSISGGTERKVNVPPDPNIGGVSFAPDGKRLAFTNTKENGIDLWVADTATGQSKLLSGTDRLNGTTGDPCDWLEDSVTLLCQFLPRSGSAPAEPNAPTGPNVQESNGKAAPAATYEDLIKTSHDENLFEHYFTGQLATIDALSGRKTSIGVPAILENVSASPSGEYLLVSRIKRPFSRLVPMRGFPKDIEIWNRRGDAVKKIADLPSSEGTPINGVQPGPRVFRWRPDQPATVTWVEALDEGNPRNNVPFRDRIVALAAPFSGTLVELARTEWRLGGLSYTEKGIGLLTESDRRTRHTRTWIVESGEQPRKLWDRRQQDAYGNPGSPIFRRDSGDGGRGGEGRGVILQHGDYIYLTGTGASPGGDRPFLDRLDLKTLKTERLFRCPEKTYESVITPLDDEAKTLLTEYETPADPPNYYARNLAAGTKRVLTQFKDPAPQLAGVAKQFVTYKRNDGVELSFTLYLPPGYKKGERLPTLMWAYPREFTDADTAGQVFGSPNRFTGRAARRTCSC